MRGIYELETLRDSSGVAVVVTGATITVRKESDGLIAHIYNAVSGGSLLANPYTIAGSTIQFYAEQNDRYRIDIASGTLTRTIRFQSVSIDTLTVKTEAATTSAGQVTAHNVDDAAHGMSASGRAVLRGTPTQGRTALELGNSATLNVGTDPGTVCAGNDPRLAESGGSGVAFVTVTPATDADVTLTSAQYGANAIRLATGAWLEARNVIMPAEAREWQFFNDGTYAATVKTAAGTGAIVQPGVTTRLICDATNVIQELTAAGTSYSGELTATDVQGAIDEVMSTRGTAATANIGTATGQLIGTDEAREYFGLEFEPSVLPTISSDFGRNKHELYEQYGNASKTILQTWTTTRSTTGTYRDAAGIIRTAAIDTPRIDYDPVTNKGALLVEEARTNLLTYSEQFDNAAWAKTNTTITANAAVAPDGTTTADKLVENTANAEHRADQSISPSAGAFTFTVFAKADDYSVIRLRPVHVGADQGDTSALLFTLTGVGSFSTPAAHVSGAITALPNGWYRCALTVTITGTITSMGHRIQLVKESSTVYLGDGTSGIYIWGAQIEASAYQSSYIPTVASAVTRTVDNVVRTLGDEFNVNSTEFTLFVEGSLPADNFRRLLRMSGPDTSGGGNSIGLGASTTAMQWFAVVQRDGVTVLPAVTTAVFIPDVVNKWAMTFRAGQIIVARNGAIYQTATGLPPIGLTTIGPHHYNTASVAASNTQSLQLIPRALSDAELQEMTKL